MLNQLESINVLILDMQPIDPPIGGGRIRLLGLYHNLGTLFSSKYIGTFDWRGEKFRDHMGSENLREINIPLSGKHFDAIEKINASLGKNVIDVTFPKLGKYSSDYIKEVAKNIEKSHVIIFSHPWVYPLVKEKLNLKKQLVIYDSHNVEAFLRYSLLDDNGGIGTNIVRDVVRVESELCHISDIILCCSHEDQKMFNNLYDIGFLKMVTIPNGVFTKKIMPVDNNQKLQAKKFFSIKKQIAGIFLGSNYGPNVEAAQFICNKVAPIFSNITFIIAGSVGQSINKTNLPDNILVTGFIEDIDKIKVLQASDFAINPMMGGSGTNIKMFDFMAAGLPVITTAIGARGIEQGNYNAMVVTEIDEIEQEINILSKDNQLVTSMGKQARLFVEEKFSFENISLLLGEIIKIHQETKIKKSSLYFSVVIPTYERHELLLKLLKKLNSQKFNNFEVIIVDQSSKKLSLNNEMYTFSFHYNHISTKGAVKARNYGSLLATGQVIAFIDDDCIPDDEWLYNAHHYLNSSTDLIGIEGLIASSRVNDPNYRTVTNVGFKEMGFMTANLFIRREIFNKLKGFDEQFDSPHFREDTDLGWRALQFGKIPYMDDVKVFHPPHKKQIERESDEERSKFFEKDALLLKKHPNKYKTLFLKEGHYLHTKGFWYYFLFGVEKYNVDIKNSNIYDYVCQYYLNYKNEKNKSVR